MKKVTVFFAVFALLILMAVPAFAWTGASGKVIDNKTNGGWAHGGTVYAIGGNGIVGTWALDTTVGPTLGNWGGAYNGVATIDGETITIVFVLNAAPGSPYPAPGIADITYTEFAVPAERNIGNVLTGTGPTAVTLQNITADNNSTAISIGFVVLMLAGVTFVMFRRREVA